jgi:phosphoglycolate phosphatase-like HAD superfamily hydrolase
MMAMLILFDIDMTLISTGGAGMKSMTDAGKELFGPSFSTDGIQFAGRLDPLIISDMLVRHGVPDEPGRHREFRDVYRRHLITRLACSTQSRSLPGVTGLLSALGPRKDLVVGLLTGNFEETGCLKLRACGIDPGQFAVRVWGDESPHHPPKREHLVPVGIARGAAARRGALRAEQVTVIGDTPHDVHCARVHGCRSLGVATGHFTQEQLREAGGDLVVADMSDHESILAWLMNGRSDHGRV